MAIALKCLRILLLVNLFIASVTLVAQDEIILKKGDPVKGEILRVQAPKFIFVKVPQGEIPFPMNNVKKIILGERPAYEKGINAYSEGKYADAIAALQPLVNKYMIPELQAAWVADAASYIAQAHAQMEKTFDAEQMAKRIVDTYRGTELEDVGKVAQAHIAFKKDQFDQAYSLINEITANVKVDEVIPPKADLIMLGGLLYMKAQVEEKKGNNVEALENYLKVALIYNKPEQRARKAQQRADLLRQKNPNLTVN
ncbi:MAG: hypothetical protein AAF984_09610 [Verrucomicrobiota bacterium]